jgi:hypothetical protein
VNGRRHKTFTHTHLTHPIFGCRDRGVLVAQSIQVYSLHSAYWCIHCTEHTGVFIAQNIEGNLKSV